jgi:ribose/xylose/arabinose/galactoside ABC-type transport system permease subunit
MVALIISAFARTTNYGRYIVYIGGGLETYLT